MVGFKILPNVIVWVHSAPAKYYGSPQKLLSLNLKGVSPELHRDHHRMKAAAGPLFWP
jgi:hypothetical protein